MMKNDVVAQWTEMSKSAVEALQQITHANAEAMGSLMQNQLSSKNLGELLKTAMTSAKDFREMNTNAFNTLLQKQFSMVDLNGSADAVKELGEIGSSTMKKFVEQQTALITLYMETNATYLEEVKNAKSAEDLVGAQTKLFGDLQSKMKDNTLQTLQTLEALKTAIGAWSEKAVDSATGK